MEAPLTKEQVKERFRKGGAREVVDLAMNLAEMALLIAYKSLINQQKFARATNDKERDEAVEELQKVGESLNKVNQRLPTLVQALKELDEEEKAKRFKE